jgi:hypothetical protein
MRNWRRSIGLAISTYALGVSCAAAQQASLPSATAADPSVALSDALSAACRADEAKFAAAFTVENADAFRALPAEERRRLMQRFSLSDDAGKPMLSADQDNHTILRCETAGGDVEFRFGAARLHENLAFVPLSVVHGQQTEIGLVREGGSWKLLSLGLVLLDIKQLMVQWAAADLSAREDAAAAALQTFSEAIDTYKRTFGKFPQTLAQLGPAPKNEMSEDQASLVNAALATGSNGGYKFSYRTFGTPDEGDRFVIDAVPADYGKSGDQSFFLDTSGKIHAADNHGDPSSATDPLWRGSGETQ